MNENKRLPYSYIVLRYVHDIGTGEFINVGIVLMAQRSPYLGARFKTTYGRVKKAFPSVDTEVFRTRMRRLQATFDQYKDGDINVPESDSPTAVNPIKRLVHSVIRVDDSSLQWSEVGNGLSNDLQATLVSLYQRFVAKYDAEHVSTTRKDEDVWKHFRTELEKRNVLPRLEQKTIAVADDSVKFEHAWKNGVWNCYEPLSFDLASDASIKEKAHRWLGQVASIQASNEKFRVYFLVGKPVDGSLNEAYQKAVSILRKAPDSEVIEEDRAEAFSHSVAQAITAHVHPPI